MPPADRRLKIFTKCLCIPLTMLLVWLTVIVWLSLTSVPPTVSGWLGWDKLQHALAYGVLAWLLAKVLVCLDFQTYRRIWWQAWILTCLFGLLLEILQHVMQRGRSAEWLDLVADGLGAMVACVIFRQIQALKAGNSEKKEE